MKKCSTCKVEKPATIEFFYKGSGYKDGLRGQCKDCINKKAKEYQENNVENYKRTSAEYYQKHKDEKTRYYKENYVRISNYNREWRKRNSDKLRSQRRELYKDPIRRLKKTFRSRLVDTIKGRSKTSAILEYLGCSYDELIAHLESKWKKGMTWDNYGNPNGDHSDCWHVDHIIPISSLGTDEDSLRILWHYSNLQPLWGKENLSKGSRLDFSDA